MERQNTLIEGSIGKGLILFALPYLLSCFMQTFYGMADLLIVGIFNGSEMTSAVSIGSQVLHMLTVIIVGLAMGATVKIGRSVGAKDKKETSKTVGATIVLFSIFAVVLTIVLLLCADPITAIMLTPKEAVSETKIYLKICFAGIPFITAYNIISSIFRGIGDSKKPMYFVAVACVVNIALDFLFIGPFHMGAAGAALATVIGQAASCLIAFVVIKRVDLGFELSKEDIRLDKTVISHILQIGVPISLQDGLIQVAFIVITVIANSRGLIASSSVGIVEKIIGFMFLVPSAFLSAISTLTAQNMGAKKPERARRALRYGLIITICWGCCCAIYSQFLPHTLVGLFTRDTAVVSAGCEYLRAYSIDTIFAAIHFCFSGYFCGNQKSIISFLHNITSILFVRIPGAYFASILFPDTLYPMGWAAPLGSILSSIICIGFYAYDTRVKDKKTVRKGK